MMGKMGFTPCSYREYLAARKVIRDREQLMHVEGRMEESEDDNK